MEMTHARYAHLAADTCTSSITY